MKPPLHTNAVNESFCDLLEMLNNDMDAVINLVSSEEESKHSSSIIDLVSSEDGCSDGAVISGVKLEVALGAAGIPNYRQKERHQRKLRRRKNPFPPKASRKPAYLRRRTTVRDSRRVYHAHTMKARYIQQYFAAPGVRAALQKLEQDDRAKVWNGTEAKLLGGVLHIDDVPFERIESGTEDEDGWSIVESEHNGSNTGSEEIKGGTWATSEPDMKAENERKGVVVCADTCEEKCSYQASIRPEEKKSYEDSPGASIWPSNVTKSLQVVAAAGVELKDSWEADYCECVINCYRGSCSNAVASLYCAKDNCHLKGHCSNSIFESNDVELFRSETGIGVRATTDILLGSTIAPYSGILTDHDHDKDPEQFEYVIALQSRGKGNKRLFINAENQGSVARFINHSCQPNTEFVEMRHNRDVHILVITLRQIMAGEEVTVDYDPDLWFKCSCKSATCRGKP